MSQHQAGVGCQSHF